MNQLSVDALMEFKNQMEETYASQSGSDIHKKLVVTALGNYKVYHNKELILETMQPFTAIEKYNDLGGHQL